jgi:hypothetical protein
MPHRCGEMPEQGELSVRGRRRSRGLLRERARCCDGARVAPSAVGGGAGVDRGDRGADENARSVELARGRRRWSFAGALPLPRSYSPPPPHLVTISSSESHMVLLRHSAGSTVQPFMEFSVLENDSLQTPKVLLNFLNLTPECDTELQRFDQ